MQLFELNKYLNDRELVHTKIQEFLHNNILASGSIQGKEVQGHIQKAEHNLRFVQDNINLSYLDWAITGSYYASYHAALALNYSKGFSSKNHLATLLILISEFYQNGLNEEDLSNFAVLLDYQDILFYVEAKNKREDASYTTSTKYSVKDAQQLRIKSALFVAKVKEILKAED